MHPRSTTPGVPFSLGPALLLLAVPLFGSGCVIDAHSHYSWSIENWESASREETAPLAIESGDRLVIGGATGDITVKAMAGVAPHFVAKITGHGETTADAERVRDAVRIATERVGRDVVIRVISEKVEFGDEHVKMSIEPQAAFSVIVPEGVSLDLRTASGDIVAAGPVGGCALDSSYGDVSVADAAGEVTARSASGDVRLKNVTGPFVEGRSSYGDIEMAAVRADRIVAKTNSGEVSLVRTSGATAVESGYGDVVIEGAIGSLTASSSSGDITVRNFSGNDGAPTTVELDSGYGEIELSGTFGALSAQSASGDVVVVAFPGSRVDGTWRLASGYGTVDLSIPADFACVLDAHTSHGEIESDFAVRVDAGKASARDLRGRIGAGGERTLRLETSSGDIRLRRAGSD